jgi:hypothetical protein
MTKLPHRPDRLLLAYLRRQIAEIAGDPALRAYGLALVAVHGLTALWLLYYDIAPMLAVGHEAICWPLLPDCERLRVLSTPALDGIFRAYAVASLLAVAGFLRKEWCGRGYAALVLLTIFKLLVLALDFRLRRNQHYMAFAVTGVFLLVPHKRQALRLLLVLFYFWAGTLKLDREWLSGGGLYKPLWLFTGRGVVLACAYVVVLELVVVWGLLARRPWIFWAALAQVIAFHVFSWGVVGFFYPVLMFMLLAIFVLCRLLPPADPAPGLLATLAAWRAPRPVYALAAAFSLLQLSTHLYPGDTALTGEGRLFALHMFDARVECDAWATLKLPDGPRLKVNLRGDGARGGCDPVTIYGAARNLCRRQAAGRLDFAALDVHLVSRRTTDPAARPVIDYPDFCARMPRYSAVGHNEWIVAR